VRLLEGKFPVDEEQGLNETLSTMKCLQLMIKTPKQNTIIKRGDTFLSKENLWILLSFEIMKNWLVTFFNSPSLASSLILLNRKKTV